MKMSKLFCTLAVAFFSTQCFAAVDYLLWGAASPESAYKWTDNTANQPWGNGAQPTEVDYVAWKGASSGNVGYVKVNTDTTFARLQVASSGSNTVANFIFDTGLDGAVSHTMKVSDMIETLGRGCRFNFYAADGNTGQLSYVSGKQISLNTDAGNNPFVIGIGKNTTLTFTDDTVELLNNGGGVPGSIQLYDGGNFNFQGRINLKGSGDTSHRDIVIGANSTFSGYQLGLYYDTGFTVEGSMIITQGIMNNVISFDLVGENSLVDFTGNDSLEGIIAGISAEIRITNFRANSFHIKYSDELKTVVENQFYTYDGTSWVNNLTLNSDGWVVAVVPEPADWAVVFGVAALAVAAYRRKR